MKLAGAPARAAATAWLEPLPPGPSWKERPMKVSPQVGSLSVRKARSATKLPMTVTHLVDMYSLDFRASLNGGACGLRRLHKGARRSEERRVGKECRSRWSPY